MPTITKNKFILLFISTSAIIWLITLESFTTKASYGNFSLLNPMPGTPSLFNHGPILSDEKQDVPEVELILSENRDFYSWGSQVRYTINVSDIRDGQSKYGEIDGNEVIMEIEYLPITSGEDIKEKMKRFEKKPEPPGLSLMKKSTCFGCHADKTRLAGPSFLQIAERYEKNLSTIKSLAGSISRGSSGVWGSSIMPAHPDFTEKEREQIAEYILEQGGRKNKWILPGLEGTFDIVKKPDNYAKGMYILTASYSSKSGVKGQKSIIIQIK